MDDEAGFFLFLCCGACCTSKGGGWGPNSYLFCVITEVRSSSKLETYREIAYIECRAPSLPESTISQTRPSYPSPPCSRRTVRSYPDDTNPSPPMTPKLTTVSSCPGTLHSGGTSTTFPPSVPPHPPPAILPCPTASHTLISVHFSFPIYPTAMRVVPGNTVMARISA